MKEKLTKIVIYSAGFFCVIVFMVVRLKEPPELFFDSIQSKESEKQYTVGDLYLMNNVENFNTHLPGENTPYHLSSKQPALEDAEILLFGDSFVAMRSKGYHYPDIISDTLKKKLYVSHSKSPVDDLRQAGFNNNNGKVLIFEIVERNILNDFRVNKASPQTKMQSLIDAKVFIFPYDMDMKYDYLLARSRLTSWIYGKIATLKFNLFGYISASTPVYIKDPPWLFYKQDVSDKAADKGFYYKFSDSELKNVCDNILSMKRVLKEEYNLDFIFFPIPNKYTIYHTLLNNDEYNNLLPDLYAELDKRGVQTVKVYDEFKNSKKLLYYPTDTHWSQEGINISAGKTIELLKQYDY